MLFASAGIAKFAPYTASQETLFDELFATYVKGVYFTLQKAIPLLNDGASVIFNTSVVASKGTENVGVYAATKSAVRSFARTAATIRAPQSSSSSLVQSIPAQHLVGVHVLVRPAPSSSGSWRLSAYQTFFASAFIEPSNRAGKSSARALRSLAVVI